MFELNCEHRCACAAARTDGKGRVLNPEQSQVIRDLIVNFLADLYNLEMK